MHAARFHRYGSPDVLVVEDAPEPHASIGAVRVKVLAASVNPIDVLLRAGRLSDVLPLELPAIPGRDAVGIVDEVGPDVTGTRIGDRVFGLGGLSDTTAQYAVLTAWTAAPEQWTHEEAAAAGLASATAEAALEGLGVLSGRTLLVQGASGAVGGALTAFALAAGARVIGTARPRHHERLRAAGIEPTTYGPGLVERLHRLAPAGVDLAVNAAPSDSLPDLVRIVGDAARVVTVVGSADVGRLGVRAVNARNDSALLDRAADLARRGGYTPRVDRVLPLHAAAEAHTSAEASTGKVVITLQ